MKATSHIFQSLQAPVTIFGLPPKLLIIVLGASTPVIPILTLFGLSALSLIAPIIFFVIGGAITWRMRRKDPHCETVIFIPKQFFKGKKQRLLIAGEKHTSLNKRK